MSRPFFARDFSLRGIYGILFLQISAKGVDFLYRVFLVEDDQGIANGIARLCADWGMQAHCAENLYDIMPEFAAHSPHLVLLDIALPFFNGYHWCAKIRQVSKVPILFLSSAADGMNMVMAMNLGADDFIAKPFDSAVLIAKIQALLRRAYDFGTGVNVLEHGGALLDTAQQTLCYGEKTVALSKNEFRILLVLMEHKGQVVSREMLMQKLWESESFVDENTLSVNVNRLRKRLEQVGLCDFIETKFGVGYLIRA